MAAIDDWVKVEKSTARKPEVLQIASALGVHPDEAFGLCIRFWMWVDDNLSQECRAMCATKSVLDTLIGRDGFTTQLVNVGWLEIHDDHIRIPNFDRHLSKSSKKRAENNKRQKGCRADVAQNEQKMSRKLRDKRVTKDAQDKERSNTPPNPQGGVIVSDDIAERIYNAYPRKVAKPAALKAIRKALESIDGESLLALVEAYSEARRGQDQQYTPHPATWFNGQRWADDPQTWRTDDKRQPDLFGGIRDWLEEDNVHQG